MTPVWDRPGEARDFVANGLWGDGRNFGPCYAMGFANEDVGFVAGVVFHNYEQQAGVIELSAHSTSRRWLTRERLRWIFSYPFQRLGCRIAVARISERNSRTLRIWRALGADLIEIPDLRAEGEAEVVATLKRDVWARSKFMR